MTMDRLALSRAIGLATPARLRDGGWGVRVCIDAPANQVRRDRLRGETVTVRSRGGKTWEAEIEACLWLGRGDEGGSVALCSTVQRRRESGGRRYEGHRSDYGGRCRGDGCGQPAEIDGYCRQCHFDEFDC